MTGARLVLAFASTAERRACAPPRLLDTCGRDAGMALVTLQVGLAASQLSALAGSMNGIAGLVSCGLAGGLDPGLPAGTLLLPERVVSRDGASLEVDVHWHRRVLERLQSLAPITTGPLADGGALVASPLQKRLLQQASGAVAVDMESAMLARWAGRQRLPFLVLRVLLDPADVALPEWSQVALRPDGNTNLAALSLALLRRPAGLLELPVLAHGLGTAAARWRQALATLGPALRPDAATP